MVAAIDAVLETGTAGALAWSLRYRNRDGGFYWHVVERASRKKGPWTIAGKNIDETAVQYRPQFADTQAAKGQGFYRVLARNEDVLSKPSNTIGPVKVAQRTLVDESADLSQIQLRLGALEIQTRDCRKAKEDAHRLAGKAEMEDHHPIAVKPQRFLRSAFMRFHASSRARLFASLASGASPARMKPWPAPS